MGQVDGWGDFVRGLKRQRGRRRVVAWVASSPLLFLVILWLVSIVVVLALALSR